MIWNRFQRLGLSAKNYISKPASGSAFELVFSRFPPAVEPSALAVQPIETVVRLPAYFVRSCHLFDRSRSLFGNRLNSG